MSSSLTCHNCLGKAARGYLTWVLLGTSGALLVVRKGVDPTGQKECQAALKSELHSQLWSHVTSADCKNESFLVAVAQRGSYTLRVHPLSSVPNVPLHGGISVIRSYSMLDTSHLLCWGMQTVVCLNPFPKEEPGLLHHLPRDRAGFEPIVLNRPGPFLPTTLPQTVDAQALGPARWNAEGTDR